MKNILAAAAGALVLGTVLAISIAVYAGVLYGLLHNNLAFGFFDYARILLALGVLTVYVTGIARTASGANRKS